MRRLLLASASPRRRELLAALIADFDVTPTDVPEVLTNDGRADARRLAVAKALSIATPHPGALVIGSDTVVHDGLLTYGKPATAPEAVVMLSTLQGRQHVVTTAVAVAFDGRLEVAASDATVELAPLSDAEIRAYVASGRPMDKAGAYAIQDDDVPTVARLSGCYCCVMGLPLWQLAGMLGRAGADFSDPCLMFERCCTCQERPTTLPSP
jgi:septum formation protein